MIAAAHSIPSYEQLLDEIRFLEHQNKELREDKEHLEDIVRLLKRLRFAPKSEIHGGQGALFNESETLNAEDMESDAEAAPAVDPQNGPKPKSRGKPVRTSLPADLPRVDTVIDLPEAEKTCPTTGMPLPRIGAEISEQLDVKPAERFVLRTIRPKYGPCPCPDCQAKRDGPTTAADAVATIKIMPLPAQPIPKSCASPGLLAHIATAKYRDGLPLYRQEEILGRIGIELSRQTIAGWMVRCGEIIKPLINLAKDELMSGPVILCDETRVQVLKGTGKKPTAKSYMWCFTSGAATQRQVVIFELGPSRSHEVPMKFLDGYEGYLHTDGYEAYETLAAKMPKIILVGDWVHARRKFDEAIKAFPKDFKGEIKVKVGFDLINEIFRIDRDEIPDGATLEETHRIRQEQSLPLLGKLKAWADETLPTMRPKSLSAVALRYMMERWEKLTIFLKDPILGLSTNGVENAIRPFVMGRKAWLFSASLAGAESSAALYSLISMAHAYELNPTEYLKAVFTEMPRAQTADQVEALLPWNWKPATPH